MITFGICVSDKHQAQKAIDSIRSIKHIGMIDFEIIAIGDKNKLPDSEFVRLLEFDETVKHAWITRKKNLIVKAARWPHICLIHDYYIFDSDWFVNLVNYNRLAPAWDLLQARIYTKEGERHSDWIVNQKYMDVVIDKVPELGQELMGIAPHENGPRWVCGLPYGENRLTHIQYISGGYILGTKRMFEAVPFNENLVWGQAEDIEWSERVIAAGYRPIMRNDMIMRTDKPGKWKVYEMTPRCVEELVKEFG